MTVSVTRWLFAFALAIGWVTLGGAQGQAALAIVGARIVDGSGNEPFVGTLIVEAGRIKAVGRSVEVPAGAATVDGNGRTLLPGLIDTLLTLEGQSPQQSAAALAAALYAGVTSAAVVGVPVERLEALRTGSGRPDTGPRLTAVGSQAAGPATAGAPADWSRVFRSGAQAIVVAADGAGVEAVASDARSRGLRLIVDAHSGGGAGAVALTPHLVVGSAGLADAAALVAQNVTVAPDLLASVPVRLLGDAPAPGDLSSQAPRPATDAAAPDDLARWDGSVASVKALRDARVRMAVASRVGSRLPPGQATHAAARLLVDAGLTPLQAVTAATSGGAWALGVQSDRGFLAPGMRADLVLVQGDPATTVADLSRVERVFLNGAEVDRPALLIKVRSADPTPPSPEPAKPTSTQTAVTDAPAVTKVPPAGRSTRRRRGAIEPKMPDAPTSADAAPSDRSGIVTPPLPAALPEATSAAAPPAETAIKPAAPVRLSAALIDDFEHEDRSAAGPGWSSASSEGSTPATIIMGRVVRGLRDHALHLTARMGEGKAPFARVSIPLTDGGRPVDAGRFRGLRFDARGEGRYRIVFVTRAIVDGRHYESYFSGSPLWTPVGIPFASIGQNGKGTHDSFTGRDLIEIRFEVARDPGRMGWLELDNLRFY